MKSVASGRWAAALLIGHLALAGSAAAQAAEGKPSGASPGRRAAGSAPEDVRQAMEQMVIARMKVALHLTEEQEASVIPRVEELMGVRRDHAAKRRAAMARLRALLLDETAGDQEIASALKETRAIEDDYRDREEGLREAIASDLTPRQQARMVFFMARLHQVMQRRLQQTLGGRPGPGPRRGIAAAPRRGPGPAAPPAEEDLEWPGAPEEDL